MREYNWNALKRIRTERFHWEIAKRISICAIFILPILFYLMKIFIYDSMLVFAIFSIISNCRNTWRNGFKNFLLKNNFYLTSLSEIIQKYSKQKMNQNWAIKLVFWFIFYYVLKFFRYLTSFNRYFSKKLAKMKF